VLFPEAVRTDEANAFARADIEVYAVEGNESAESLRETLGAKQGRRTHAALRLLVRPRRPISPCGARTTNPIRSKPTTSRLTSEEMVTVKICWAIPRRSAPSTGPNHAVVPPINGMAIEFTE
jgi:hypothetical protein